VKPSRGGVVAREELRGDEIKTPTQFFVEEGDFIISRRQIIHGACGFVPPELSGAVVSNEYDVLRPRRELVPGYLRELIHTEYLQRTFFHSSVGVDVEKMVFNLEHWGQFRIHLPPTSEQERIQASLATVDKTIVEHRSALEHQHKIKNLLLRRFMSKGVFRESINGSAVGPIPESWEIARIGELGEVVLGRQRSPTFVEGEERPYLRVANVHDGYIDTSDILRMPFTDKEFERYSLRPGDILLNEGQSRDLVGRCAIFNNEVLGCCFQNTLIRFRSNSRLLQRFAYYAFQYQRLKGNFARIATQTTSIAHLGADRLANLSIAVPSLHEQKVIAEHLEAIDMVISSSEQMRSNLLRTKTALQQALLSGRVRV
jgi:type I restriction enzyme S subunit